MPEAARPGRLTVTNLENIRHHFQKERQMPFVPLTPEEEKQFKPSCQDSEHNPPTHMVIQYPMKWVCPSCGTSVMLLPSQISYGDSTREHTGWLKACRTSFFGLIAVLFMFAASASAQPMPPTPPKVVTPKAKMTPATPKAGDLLVIDASSAAGNVKFYHQFPTGTFVVDGKKLVVAVPQAAKNTKLWSIQIVYFREESDEQLSVKILGTDAPTPTPPDGTLASLTVAVNALTKQVTAMQATLSSIDKRVTALEGAKPPPVIVPPDAFTAALQAAYVADGKDAANLAKLISLYKLSPSIINDATLTKEGDIVAKMHASAQALFNETDKVTVLPNVRAALQAEFNKVLGGKTADPLTPALRASIAAEFSKAQAALQGVMP